MSITNRCLSGFAALCLFISAGAQAHVPHVCPDGFSDFPGLPGHLEQTDITTGAVSFANVFAQGQTLFTAIFNVCDGQGRPATTGNQLARAPVDPHFARIGGPDTNACAGCHFQPMIGGAADFAGNVFHGAQMVDPMTTSTSEDVSSLRNTPATFGAGAVDQLAREMTAELQSKARRLPDGWNTITTKGISFQVQSLSRKIVDSIGVNPDLVIRPFGVTGEGASLRVFSRDAFNNHHGMQAEEIFDFDPTRGADFDMDGVSRELTVGDLTATTVFQAALPIPGRVLPTDTTELGRVTRGESLFASLGCSSCHVPELVLKSRIFNDGTGFTFNMVTNGQTPRLTPSGRSAARVRLYGDLKIHNLCDPVGQVDAVRHFCNEHHGTETRRDQLDNTKTLRPGAEFFITAELWSVGNTAPYGHRGDLPTIYEAILAHGGEARAIRDSYLVQTQTDRENVVMFLKTLRAPIQAGTLLVNGVPQ